MLSSVSVAGQALKYKSRKPNDPTARDLVDLSIWDAECMAMLLNDTGGTSVVITSVSLVHCFLCLHDGF